MPPPPLKRCKGSITPGKWADLVVLSRDFAVPADIPDIQIDVTIVGGQIRYRRSDSIGRKKA